MVEFFIEAMPDQLVVLEEAVIFSSIEIWLVLDFLHATSKDKESDGLVKC